MTLKGRVSPFGCPRIKACSQLPVAFRSVPRPSSPLNAKASTKCSYLTLDPPEIGPRVPRHPPAKGKCPKPKLQTSGTFSFRSDKDLREHSKHPNPKAIAKSHSLKGPMPEHPLRQFRYTMSNSQKLKKTHQTPPQNQKGLGGGDRDRTDDL